MILSKLYETIEPKIKAISNVEEVKLDKNEIIILFRDVSESDFRKQLKIKKESCFVDKFAVSFKNNRKVTIEKDKLLKMGADFKKTFGAKYKECGVLSPTVLSEMLALNEKHDNCYSQNEEDSFETMFTDNSNKFCIGKAEDNKARIYAQYIKTDNGYLENTIRVKTVDLRTEKDFEDFIKWIANIEVNFF